MVIPQAQHAWASQSITFPLPVRWQNGSIYQL